MEVGRHSGASGEARWPAVGVVTRRRTGYRAFPELHGLAQTLPDGVVLDGEILVWKPGETETELAVQPFALLQQRIGRKTLGKSC